MSLRLLLCSFLVCLSMAGCNRQTVQESSTSVVPGVTEDEILIGSSLALTGHAGYLGTQTLRGALAYLNRVNEEGGVHGRTIRVIAKDDGYDPPRCLVNTQQLIIDENVFSLFCYVGTPTTVKILPLVQDARIPLVGMFTGANALREPFKPYVINVRPSYYQETGAAVRHLVEMGIHKIGIFYQYDAYGFDGLTGTELALQDFGLEPEARGTYVRGTLDVEEGLRKIMDSEPEAVFMIGTYDPCAKFIKLARAQGFNPIFYLVSFVGAEELARRLGSEQDGTIIMSQVVPPPESNEAGEIIEMANSYTQDLEQYFPEDKPNFVGFEGYINATVLVEGLRRAGRDLNRENFIKAIESIGNYSLGPNYTLSFSPTNHQGLERVFFTSLNNGRFELITDWNAIRTRWATSRNTLSLFGE
ncbi:MAG: ABC transporter substrate-binding protein [Desulfovibrionales bacterium]